MDKRLLISTTYYLPNVSGITKYIQVLAEELKKRGFTVTILTSRHWNNLNKQEITNGVIIKRLWAPMKIGKGVIMPGFPFVFLKEIFRTDAINCHLPSLESVFIAGLNIFFRKRLIVTYHCEFDSGNNFINKLVNWVHSFILKHSDVIVVNSKDYIEGYGLLKDYRKKIIEIYPPVVTKKNDKKEKIKIDKKFKEHKNRKIIGFLGRISKEKNLEILLETIPYLKKKRINFRIALAGPDKVIGEDGYRKNIEKILVKNKDVILRIGEVKNVNVFLEKCDCLVVTSNNRLESFGMVQLEAIKNGVPCVSSNLPGVRTVVQQTKMGEIFKPNSAKDLSERLIEVLLNGKEFYKKRVINLDCFNYKKSINRYEEILGNN